MPVPPPPNLSEEAIAASRRFFFQAMATAGEIPAHYATMPLHVMDDVLLLDDKHDYDSKGDLSKAGRRRQAAKKVFDCLEIRQCIYGMMDRKQLVKMLRVEKAGLASVAGVLYKRIHTSQVIKFTRQSPIYPVPESLNLGFRSEREIHQLIVQVNATRRPIYCRAVQILDQSPYPKHQNPLNIAKSKKKHVSPVRMRPAQILVDVADAKKLFPNLRKVLYHYPSVGDHDAYVVTIRNNKIIVDVESRFVYDLHVDPPIPGDSDAFPRIPTRKDMDIHQTISLKLVDQYPRTLKTTRDESMARYTQIDKWRKWVHHNPDLDRRIVSIDHSEFELLTVTMDETKAFVTQRRACEPLRSLIIPSELDPFAHIGTPRTPARPSTPKEILALLNPERRSLSIPEEILWKFGSPAHAFTALDKALPSLHNLTITYPFIGVRYFRPLLTSPIVAFPNLRCFTFRPGGGQGSHPSSRLYANIGSCDCIFQNVDLPAKDMKTFTDWVNMSKRGLGEEETEDDYSDYDYGRYDSDSDEDDFGGPRSSGMEGWTWNGRDVVLPGTGKVTKKTTKKTTKKKGASTGRRR